jgi:hypothetical protein
MYKVVRTTGQVAWLQPRAKGQLGALACPAKAIFPGMFSKLISTQICGYQLAYRFKNSKVLRLNSSTFS